MRMRRGDIGVEVECAVGGLEHCARGGCDSDQIWIAVVCGALDSITCRKERVESLYEGWVTVEEVGNTFDNTGGIDAEKKEGGEHMAWGTSVMGDEMNEIGRRAVVMMWKEETYYWLLKSFMISRNLLYTSGLSWNCILTESR